MIGGTHNSRWCARMALVVLGFAVPMALVVMPVHAHHVVWPLSMRWAHAHLFADAGVLIGYFLLGLVSIVMAVSCLIHLFRLAGWKQ